MIAEGLLEVTVDLVMNAEGILQQPREYQKVRADRSRVAREAWK